MPTPQGGLNQARGSINGAGKVVASVQVRENPAVDYYDSHVFHWDDDGKLTDLGRGVAAGINDLGQIAGTSIDGASVGAARFWDPATSTWTTLGLLREPGNAASVAINSAGQVVGHATTTYGNITQWHAFISAANGGAIRDLGTLYSPYENVYAQGINDLGQVIGYVNNSPLWAGFVTEPGTGRNIDLGLFGGGTSNTPYAINNLGQVVGRVSGADYFQRGYLYSGGRIADLNDLILPGSGLTIISANGISDTGYIAAIGQTPDGRLKPLLLTPQLAPVPEPSGMILLGVGAAGLLAIRTLRRRRPTHPGSLTL